MSTASALCGGFQTVTISQDNLCYFTDSVMIPSPAPIQLDTANISPVSCYGENDATIALVASGGTGVLGYDWGPSLPPGPIQFQLFAGTYPVTITDANGCTLVDSVVVTQPDSLIAMIDSSATLPVSCVGQNSGQITVTQTGGRPGYSYTWSPAVSTSAVATGLDAGSYFITVTDNAGCTDSVSFTLTGSPPVIGYVPPVPAPACFGEQSLITVDSATGGVGGFTFSINGGQQYPLDTAIAVSPGAYFVIVQDSLGCNDTTSIIIDNPEPLNLEVIPEDPVVDLGDSLLLQILANGSQGSIDSVSWSFSGPLTCYDCPSPYALNTLPSTYRVTVIDTAGCVATIDVFVDVNSNRQVYIPNIFSPNFDGRNDDFVIQLGQGVLGVPSLRVFNRWGELMAQRLNVGINGGDVFVWDGMFNGKEMPPGVYVYMIEVAFADGETLIYRGDLTLLK
ncbi:MAG: gliding motility-associated C-terminal domain-containing protein, partial [Saprospiraceae bacterium]|nr:gliding motility-associated C-terminal domain-containing protein [Saprospiraceae bacterium]